MKLDDFLWMLLEENLVIFLKWVYAEKNLKKRKKIPFLKEKIGLMVDKTGRMVYI